MTSKRNIIVVGYTTDKKTIAQFREDYYSIDCQPVGQRLPVYTKNNSKSIGIIETLLNGEAIGMITIMNLPTENSLNRSDRREFEKAFRSESIDGGHRKRAIWAFLNDEFKVDGYFFSEMEDTLKKSFLEIELSFTVYEPLTTAKKGGIFRNLNKTTDVNFIEMINSYGNIPIANYIREKVRFIEQINNTFHILFKYHKSIKSEVIYDFLAFDNDRLKQDHLFARIVHRYITSPKELLGGTTDDALEDMYKDKTIIDVPNSIDNKIVEHLDFLRLMAEARIIKLKAGLTLHDFKALSALYFYLLDSYKSFKIKDHMIFFEKFSEANEALKNPKASNKFTKIIHDESGYTVQVMYKRYMNAPQHADKTTTAISYLIREMGDIDSLIIPKDPKRNFVISDKKTKLAEQGFICGIDGMKLNYKDAHAAHIVAHANGGKTVYSNLMMVRACYNQEMGTMDVNTYKESFKKAA